MVPLCKVRAWAHVSRTAHSGGCKHTHPMEQDESTRAAGIGAIVRGSKTRRKGGSGKRPVKPAVFQSVPTGVAARESPGLTTCHRPAVSRQSVPLKRAGRRRRTLGDRSLPSRCCGSKVADRAGKTGASRPSYRDRATVISEGNGGRRIVLRSGKVFGDGFIFQGRTHCELET